MGTEKLFDIIIDRMVEVTCTVRDSPWNYPTYTPRFFKSYQLSLREIDKSNGKKLGRAGRTKLKTLHHKDLGNNM